MNSTKAICGHYTWAIGAPNSKARERCETSLCPKCEEIVFYWIADTNTKRPELRKEREDLCKRIFKDYL